MSSSRPAPLSRTALSTCAAVLAGGTLLSACPAAHAEAAGPRPPDHMSAVGGARLGRSGTQVSPAPGVPALPRTTALSWIVSDETTGQVLAAHNAHWPLPPASTLKMLLADTLIPKFPRSEVHRVVPSDLAGMGAGSSLVGIVPGLTYTVQNLWQGVFLRSGNDAVHVLAAMNGGVARTVGQMRARALALGADDTHVVTPDGYDEPGQVSSAYDLSLFARAGLRDPDFRQYCSTVTARFPGAYQKTVKRGGGDAPAKETGARQSFAIQNTDRLLSGDPAGGLKPYPGIEGVKNGYTTDAGNTYTGLADRHGVKLLVTVMHPAAGDDKVYKEAAALLDWGFTADGKVRPVGTLVDPAESGTGNAAPGPGAAAGRTRATAAVRAGSGSLGGGAVAGITVGALAVLGGAVALLRRRRPGPGRSRHG